MSAEVGFYPVDEARARLDDFVAAAEESPLVGSYEQLEEIFNQELALAYRSLIYQAGEPVHSRMSTVRAELGNRVGRSRIWGAVRSHSWETEPRYIELVEYKGRIREKRSQLMMLGIDGLDYCAQAIDERDVYYPYVVSPSFIDAFGNGVGERLVYDIDNVGTSGIAIAQQARTKAGPTLDGFLRVAADITAKLIHEN